MESSKEETELLSAALQTARSVRLAKRRAEDALSRKSEQLALAASSMRATLEAVPDGILVTDDRGGVTDFNARFLDLWGLDGAATETGDAAAIVQIIGGQLVGPEDFHAELSRIAKESPRDTFHVLECKDGRTIERYSSIQRIGIRPVGRVWCFRDITTRRRSDNRLRETYEQFENLINQAPIGIYVVDADLVVRQVNPLARPAFAPEEELLGMNFAEIMTRRWPPAVAAEIVARFRHVLLTGESYFSAAFSDHQVDRDVREHYDWQIHRIRMPDGHPGVVCYFTNVTVHIEAKRTLQRQEERLRAIFDQAAVGIAIAKLDGQLEQTNRRFAEILGYTLEEIASRSIRDLTHPDDRRQTAENMRLLIAGGVPGYSLEKRYLRRDGQTVWCYASVALLRSPQGEPEAFVGVIEDVTRRRIAEETVRENAQRLQLAFSAAQLGSWTWHVHDDTVIFGERGAEIFGLAGDQAVTWSQMRELLHEEDRERARLAVEKALEERSAYDIEYRVRLPAGDYRWVVAQGHGIYNDAGEVVRMTGVVQDISKSKQYEDELRASALRYQGLADEHRRTAEALREEYAITEELHKVATALATELNIEKIVQLITDASTRATRAQFGAFFYNQRDAKGDVYTLYALAGAPRSAFQKFPLPRATHLFGPTFRGEGVIRIDDVRLDPRFGKNAPIHGMPAGHLPVVSYLAAPVVGRSGEVLGGLFFGHAQAGVFKKRDETIVVAMAAQAAGAVDTAQVYQAEQQARSAAERANQTKDDFLAALSHELRTPLTPVLAFLSGLGSREHVPADLAADLSMIRRNVELETRLIDDLLDLTRIARGKFELQLQESNIGQIIDDAISTCRPDWEAKGITLDCKMESPGDLAVMDGARITQVLWNLLKNAIKFTPTGGNITVSQRTEHDGQTGRLIVSVQDSGLGIPADRLEHVFEAFEQGGRDVTRQFGGLGLGLAIAKAIIDAHKGKVSAESAGPSLGSTFTFILPIAERAPSRQISAPPERRNPEAAGAIASRSPGCCILLVEDHADTRAIIAKLLRRSGHEIFQAATAAEALQHARDSKLHRRIDLVVSDLGLPDSSGIELMRELSGEWGLRGIALSGYGMESDREHSRAAGFVRHLTKPVDIDALLKAIREVTEDDTPKPGQKRPPIP